MAVAEPERGQAGLPVFAIGNYEILLGVPEGTTVGAVNCHQ